MRKILFTLLAVTFIFASFGVSWAESEWAMKLCAQNGLSEFSPSDAFLNGNFVADEVDPQYVFGKVKDFLQARSCPNSWLIDGGEKKRLHQENRSGPIEYTLYLEEDCPGKVLYYIFVDRSQAKAAQWMEWRKQFHKNKAESQYAAVLAVLEQAAQNGYPVDAELRFVEIGGDLQMKKNEDFLIGDLKFRPIYDLKQAKAAAK